MPDHWQARKWRDAQRLPAGVSAPAVGTVPDFDPGHTFVVHELVRAGDPITLHSTKKIPTAKALMKKKENWHTYYHKSRMVYLYSKPFSGKSKEWMARQHQVGGLINSSLNANAMFVEVGEYCIVVAHPHYIRGPPRMCFEANSSE